MPEGALGGPRPGATCRQSIKAEFNADLDSIDQTVIANQLLESKAIVLRASDITITEEIREVSGHEFELIVVQVTTRHSDIELSSVENIVSDIESIVGERVSVKVEAV